MRLECEVEATSVSSFPTMKIALFHNPGAGGRTFDGNQLIRLFAEAGHDVLYAPTQKKGWESVFRNPIERAIIAGETAPLAAWLPGWRLAIFRFASFLWVLPTIVQKLWGRLIRPKLSLLI